MKRLLMTTLSLVAVCLCGGCENKEKVLDVETPAGDIEIEKSGDDIGIEIESTDKDGDSIIIDIPKDDTSGADGQPQ